MVWDEPAFTFAFTLTHFSMMLLIVCNLLMQLLSAQLSRVHFAGTYSRHFTGVFSSVRNPAALAGMKRFSAGIYHERRFMVLQVSGAAVLVPAGAGAFGVSIWQQGYAAYREHGIGLGYGLSLGKRFQSGVRLDYQQTGGLQGAFGLTGKLTEQCSAGLHVYDIAGGLAYAVGIGYEPSAQFLLEAEWRKDAALPLAAWISGLYRPVPAFWLSGGFSTQPVQQFGGVGYRTGNLRIGILFSYHLPLGITPAITLVWGKG